MKFVLLYGPQAVGKMTIGQELAKITGLKLFHNHMTIELLEPFLGFSDEMWRISTMIREELFESYAKSDQYGMIFTYVWAFDEQEDWEFVKKVTNVFESVGAEVYLVELEADVEERLKRNVTANRLNHKPTKRNTEKSKEELLKTMETHRLNSEVGEIQHKNYLRINNTHMRAAEVALQIKETLQL
ncbi:AAA family ATPase [Aquibacillus rhizosphaerae]|uniref:AAA family ATPase n=1 Tax=Aquibacillus rhizosphaerae TaxID=3051431 RepID=A0ABT7L7B3_9BACI|nr:AAA family ATPase [Aquibacillus sp. LR5S19]MDL4841751.1 AAA family ATPase [Aquibacillus sp. LR5S19]